MADDAPLEELLETLRKQTSGEAASPAADAAARLDGERSNTRGPCRCGYKHYYQGREYDYVAPLGSSGVLVYNHDDNPYVVANQFIAKNGFASNPTVVSTIVDYIIAHTASAKGDSAPPGHGAMSSPAAPKSPVGGPLSPMLAAPEPVYTEEQRRQQEAEAARRLQQSEEVKARLHEQKMQQRREKDAIQERIRLDRAEREAERKARAQTQAPPTQVSPTAADTRTPPLHNSRSIHDITSNSADQTPLGAIRSRSSYDLQSDSPMDDVSDDENEDDYGFVPAQPSRFKHRRTSPTAAAASTPFKPSPIGDNRSRFRSMSDMVASNSGGGGSKAAPTPDEIYDLPKSKDALSFPQLAAVLEKCGMEQTRKYLLKIGHTPESAQLDLTMASLYMATGSKKPQTSPDAKPPPAAEEHAGGHVPFQGSGYSLTSSRGTSRASTSPVAAAPFVSRPIDLTLTVDPAQPATLVQVRLANGQRLAVKLNLSHTVQQLHDYVAAHSAGAEPFELMVPPRQVLSNLSLTIQEAGLQNAAVTQKPLR